LKFRVQHEIVAGITFVNKVKKGIFSSTDEIVIGSFAPQSQPHEFHFPRHGWNTAPKGMMYRGRYNATDRFIDSDGVVHLEYNYHIEISKNWRS
jgi:Rho GDP-dissociation inhibitor